MQPLQNSQWKTRWLAISDQIRSASISQFFFLIPPFALISSAGLFAIQFIQEVVQGGSLNSKYLTGTAYFLLVGSILLWSFIKFGLFNRLVPKLFKQPSEDIKKIAKAYLISFLTGLILLLIPAFLAVWKNAFHDIHWYNYGFLDKRWLIAAYLLSIFLLLVFPPVILKWLTVQKNKLTGIKEAIPRYSPLPPSLLAFKILAGIVLALYLWGPPWHLELNKTPLDGHEIVHLGALQAIDKGKIPYTEAAQTYGPGTQLITYYYMKLTSFDLVGFRESFGFLNLVAAVVFCVICFLILGPYAAIASIFLARLMSPLYFNQLANYRETLLYPGWANGLRNMGTFVLPVSIPYLLEIKNPRKLKFMAFLCGLLFGAFTWVAQENLLSGILGMGIFMILLWATDTYQKNKLLLVATFIGVGLFVFWIPVFVYYALHGQLFQFVTQYFAVASVVPQGYSNTWWGSGRNNVWINLYYYTPLFVGAAGLITLYSREHERDGFSSTPLSWNQIKFLSIICAALITYQGALFRSDHLHYIGTTMPMSPLIVLSLLLIPKFISKKKIPQRLTLAVLTLIILWLCPFKEHFKLLTFFRNPISLAKDFARTPVIKSNDDDNIGLARMGFEPANKEFLLLAQELKNSVGNRLVLVDKIWKWDVGAYYFFADLNPANRHTSPNHTITNLRDRKKFLKDLEQSEFNCIISEYFDSGRPEVSIFKKKYPRFTHVTKNFRDLTVHILCRK